MPKLDGTGPAGQGAMTGRGMGSCGGGMMRGCGCYGRRRFISPKNEITALEQDEKMLEEELAAVREERKALQETQK